MVVFSLVWKNGWVGLEDLPLHDSFMIFFGGGGEGKFLGRFLKSVLKFKGCTTEKRRSKQAATRSPEKPI